MEIWQIEGGACIAGEVGIGAAKNAVLPMMAAALLTEEPLELMSTPDITDVGRMAQLLLDLNCSVVSLGKSLRIECTHPRTHPECETERLTRASVLTLGPLLARCGSAELKLPGGCAIGRRPIDLHIAGLRSMGAEISADEHGISAQGRLHGAHIRLNVPSVGATENLMLAATLAEGETIIENAALEPEIIDLARLLTAMGAGISGAGGHVMQIRGTRKLYGARHTPIGDRIEAGTLLCAGAITGGDVRVIGARAAHMMAVLRALNDMGARVNADEHSIRVQGRAVRGIALRTGWFPGFPTDMQAPFMALLASCDSEGELIETVFENRFGHAAQLGAMGARIEIENNIAHVRGSRLRGATVQAGDLRAGAALVLGALAAVGSSRIYDSQLLRRGYDALEQKLTQLGAQLFVSETE